VEKSKTHWLADRTIEFITSQSNPWHAFVDIVLPHLPCRPSAPFSKMHASEDIPKWPGWDDEFINKPFAHAQQPWNWNLEAMQWPETAAQVARYYGVVSQIDDAIGKSLRTWILKTPL